MTRQGGIARVDLPAGAPPPPPGGGGSFWFQNSPAGICMEQDKPDYGNCVRPGSGFPR